MMRKRWLAALMIGVLAVALGAYAAAGKGSGKGSQSGGTFRIGTSSRIDSLNPYVAFNQDAYSTFEYIYPLLIQYDKANSKFIPDFATSWKISNSGKTWTFKTRKGAKWTDGKPLTSRDAAWSINTDIKYAGTGAANAAGLIAHIKNAKAPNATTLVVNYAAAPGVDQTDFIINSNPKKKAHRELLNLKVKEAFAHAIDRQQIVKVVFLGTATPASSIVPPATGGWFNKNLKPEKFDLALANKLLDQAGFKKGPGGIRVASGHKMSYQVITPTDVPSTNRSFQIMQPDFKKIGVQLSQRALDSTAAFDAISGPNNKYLNFDLAMWDWVALIDPDFMLSVVTCAQYGGWSDSGYCDKRYDRMYSQQQLTPNQDKRRALVWKMQAYLYKQRPYIWLAAQDHVWAVAKGWGGLVASPQGPFNSISKLSLTSVHQQ